MNNLELTKPIKLKYYQTDPASKVFDRIRQLKNSLLIAPVGSGKTYMVLQAIKQLREYENANSLPASKILIMPTTKGVIFWRSKAMEHGLDYDIISHDSIKSRKGIMWIDWESKMVRGKLEYVPVWIDKPDIIIFDEKQKSKGDMSLITEIAESYIQQGGCICDVSATPFALFDETYLTCLASGMCYDKGSWRSVVYSYIGSRDPHKPHSTCMARFRDDLIARGYLIKAKNVRFEKKGFIEYTPLPFENAKKPLIYAKAYEQYCERCYKAGKLPPRDARMAIWQANLQFWKMSEFLKADLLATLAVGYVKKGKQVAIGLNYIPSLLMVQKTLKKLGVELNKVGTIIGGQKDIIRQREINMFQAGKYDIMLLMLKAGGDTLTLSHNIDNGLTRPRIGLMAITWSIIDLCQLMGRLHRTDSISETTQYIVTYADTVEDKIYRTVAGKSCSLASLVGTKASIASTLAPEYVKQHAGDIYREMDDEVVNEEQFNNEYAMEAYEVK